MLAKHRCKKDCPDRRSEICRTDKCESWTKYQEYQKIAKANKAKEKQVQFYAVEGALSRHTRWIKNHAGRL